MVKGPLNPNITSLTGKLIGNLKTKIYSCYIRGKSTNDNKKRKNENFKKQKICFFLVSQRSVDPKK